jgi:two-component system, chemotaxis family, CheB/CheR fusion protein
MITNPARLTVVAIGASAGGLSALGEMVAALPIDTGFAFVVLQHQAESQVGKLAAMLAPLVRMPVRDVVDGSLLATDVIHIVPPHCRATLRNHTLAIQATGTTSPQKPIDELFASLADTFGTHAIAVVLSGMGDDGTAGLRAIHAAGGITVAQDPQTAEFDEMPRHAVASGIVDAVLPAREIGREIAILRRADAGSGAVGRIFAQLRDLAGIDFARYKRATIERRLDRQLARHRLASLDDYASYLADHPTDARELYEDLLIHVTEFFRDGPVLEQVIARVVPALIETKPANAPFRVWVPGCSTGEEVYSIGILLLEALANRGEHRDLQLFGTDLSERSIEAARSGRYPDTIAAAIGDERLARYFVKEGPKYRVVQELRERCVFVRHDVAVDPPFSRLDFVSCRNLLIYLGLPFQKKIISLLHYSLQQPGFLLVGASEVITGQEALFTALVPELALYRRVPGPPRSALSFGFRSASLKYRHPEALLIATDVFRDADHALLARYAPPCVLVDDHFDIVQFRGRTGGFLEPAPGPPQLNVFKMMHDHLATEVRTATLHARRDGTTTRVDNIALGEGPNARHVDVEVIPLLTTRLPGHCLIVFDERLPMPTATQQHVRRGTGDRVEQLEQELLATREYLSTTIAQHLAATDALEVLNEELQSANEELQSSNEELNTAKEELQSVNDELATLNTELERRNAELGQTNDDLVNVLASVEVAIIIVDVDLAVRRFTPRARALFKLIDADIGRPIADLHPSFPISDLDHVIALVIESPQVHEREIRTATGDSYRMQIRPYETSNHTIGGAVISFVDVTVLRTSIEDSQRAREVERAAQETIRRDRDAVLSAVSHELRSPLSAIVLWTEVIRGLAGADPEIERALKTIEESAHSETQLVEDLIDLSLSRAGDAVSIAVSSIEPGSILEATIAALHASAVAKRVTLDLEVQSDTKVLADPRRLRQIVQHLVTNAIKFTPAEGRVRIGGHQRDGRFELVVRDTGRGLSQEQIQTLFEPFARDDMSMTREQAGLGIGLAFVRHLIERQAGTIEINSDGHGRGTEVTVRLPAS